MPAAVRIGWIRFKDGRAPIRMMHAPKAHLRSVFERRTRASLDDHGGDISGYAVVLWDRENFSTVMFDLAEDSPMSAMQIPDFVRTLLLVELAERRTLETLRWMNGLEPAS